MAIDQGATTIAVTTQERTWRVNIETPKGADPVVTVYREVVRTGPDGAVISKEMSGTASRGLTAIAAESHTLNGKTLTMAELAGFIALIADAWRTEDIAAGKV
jgi:hypothetical protein